MRRLLRNYTGILLLLTVFYSTGYTQVIKVSSALDTNAMLIGDQINFQISVEKQLETDVTFPLFSDTLTRGIEIIGTPRTDTTLLAGKEQLLILEYTITSFDSGYYSIENIPIAFSFAGKRDTIFTRPIYLEVNTLAVDTTKAIYDIKAPIDVPLTFREVVPWILIAILAAGLAILIWYLLKRKKSGSFSIVPQKPLEPAHIAAFRMLQELKEAEIWQKGEIKVYYSRLTEIIRLYIERRFNELAMEQTSHEILQSLGHKKDIAPHELQKLRALFTLADFVKFAKANPGADDHEKSYTLAYDFVDKTMRQEEVHANINEGIESVNNSGDKEKE